MQRCRSSRNCCTLICDDRDIKEFNYHQTSNIGSTLIDNIDNKIIGQPAPVGAALTTSLFST